MRRSGAPGRAVPGVVAAAARVALALAAGAAFAADGPKAVSGAAPEGGKERREVSIAAAADLKFALEPLVASFARANPGHVARLTFGSSGSFFSQITNGAPFDLFLSADAELPRRLAEAGLTTGGDPFSYARGLLALRLPPGSALSPAKDGLRVLLDPSVRRIAIANPRHAPYGRAAESALRRAGLLDALSARLVLGENVAQAAQFVETGAADAGLVALSLSRAPAVAGSGTWWPLPEALSPPLEQSGAILKGGRNPEGARLFRELLVGREGRSALSAAAFRLPAP